MTRRLALLNGLAILGVVVSHAAGWGQIVMYSPNWVALIRTKIDPGYAPIDTLPWHVLILIRQLSVFSLAAFLFTSGWFISYAVGRQPTMSWKVVRVRLIALLIPYLIWSVIVFIVHYILNERHSFLEYLIILLTTGAAGPYYYVPLLCWLYLLSPFLVPWACKNGLSLLIVAGAIQLFTVILSYLKLVSNSPVLYSLIKLTPAWSPPNWIFYYAFGLVAGFQVEGVGRWFARLKWPALALIIPLGISASVEYEVIYHATGIPWGDVPLYASTSLYALAVIISFLTFNVEALSFSKILRQLGMRSYGIYLLHMTLMELVGRMCYHFAPAILGSQLIYVPMQIVISLGAILLFMWAVSQSPFRMSYRYLFG